MSSQTTVSKITTLPSELICQVLEMLEPRDILNLFWTHKPFQEEVSNYSWKALQKKMTPLKIPIEDDQTILSCYFLVSHFLKRQLANEPFFDSLNDETTTVIPLSSKDALLETCVHLYTKRLLKDDRYPSLFKTMYAQGSLKILDSNNFAQLPRIAINHQNFKALTPLFRLPPFTNYQEEEQKKILQSIHEDLTIIIDNPLEDDWEIPSIIYMKKELPEIFEKIDSKTIELIFKELQKKIEKELKKKIDSGNIEEILNNILKLENFLNELKGEKKSDKETLLQKYPLLFFHYHNFLHSVYHPDSDLFEFHKKSKKQNFFQIDRIYKPSSLKNNYFLSSLYEKLALQYDPLNNKRWIEIIDEIDDQSISSQFIKTIATIDQSKNKGQALEKIILHSMQLFRKGFSYSLKEDYRYPSPSKWLAELAKKLTDAPNKRVPHFFRNHLTSKEKGTLIHHLISQDPPPKDYLNLFDVKDIETITDEILQKEGSYRTKLHHFFDLLPLPTRISLASILKFVKANTTTIDFIKTIDYIDKRLSYWTHLSGEDLVQLATTFCETTDPVEGWIDPSNLTKAQKIIETFCYDERIQEKEASQFYEKINQDAQKELIRPHYQYTSFTTQNHFFLLTDKAFDRLLEKISLDGWEKRNHLFLQINIRRRIRENSLPHDFLDRLPKATSLAIINILKEKKIALPDSIVLPKRPSSQETIENFPNLASNSSSNSNSFDAFENKEATLSNLKEEPYSQDLPPQEKNKTCINESGPNDSSKKEEYQPQNWTEWVYSKLILYYQWIVNLLIFFQQKR